jgi:hypothetical protein
LEDSEWQDIKAKLISLQRRSLGPGIVAPDYLLFPTPIASSSVKARPAGITKLDRWWKEKGLIPNGWQLSAEAMAKIQGYPANWFKALSAQCPHLK